MSHPLSRSVSLSLSGMGLKEIGVALPPGFRFYPSDEELVCHYLYKKIAREDVLRGTLVDIDLHTCEPWQLPDVAKLNSSEWYFFSFRDRKYATGYRTNRATTSGYWKATGKDRAVMDPITRAVVGMRKTLVFYKNRAPNGIKTCWIMHEFRLENPHSPPKEDWVLCRVFHKSRSESNDKFDAYDPMAGCEFYSNMPHESMHNNYREVEVQNPSSIALALSGEYLPEEDAGNNGSCCRHRGIKFLDDETTKYNEDVDEYGFLFDASFNYDNMKLDHDDATSASLFV
ncbi:protein CUP-SHAPED COTYLEDON 3-like [Andrographis paniculata]|uniref:protein CUP-SHAPED COTYLEDON 3-like n=1 Tax=Andrographis paniculata TaxID=175694 RepID=UPI0021E8C48F|nr:protein CUP-SHAPED COTYLEDON 3-like [Andrographis paniculata]